mmetsp:Transcript_38688/g.58865  ORF Transcript_38688/g.58865 Transcript_38688/m.58865 type:complete len:110 (+) Transcript_38688:1582-1911(+)
MFLSLSLKSQPLLFFLFSFPLVLSLLLFFSSLALQFFNFSAMPLFLLESPPFDVFSLASELVSLLLLSQLLLADSLGLFLSELKLLKSVRLFFESPLGNYIFFSDSELL